MKAGLGQSVCGRCGAPAIRFFLQPGPRSQRTDKRRFAACSDPDHIAAAERAWARHFELDRKTLEIVRGDPQGHLF